MKILYFLTIAIFFLVDYLISKCLYNQIQKEDGTCNCKR